MSYQVIYKYNRPYGIRNSGGFVIFFPKISKYTDQEERYLSEMKEQFEFAEKVCSYLNQ